MNTSTLSAALVADAQSHQGESLGIVADRRLSVAALVALLLRDPRYRVIHELRGMAELSQAFQSFRPSILVVDSTFTGWPTSIDPAQWSGRTVLLLDPEDEPDVFIRAALGGVQGYVSRTASRGAFAMAIDTLRSTGYYLDPLLGGRILTAMRDGGRQTGSARSSLSQHERAILVRIASGRSSKEIAREYAITAKTVANHVTNMYQKLNLSHRGELVLYAMREGLTSPQSPDTGTTIPFTAATPVR